MGAFAGLGVAVAIQVDYRAWRLSPRSSEFEEFVDEVMASWRVSGGEPDIGLDLPRWLEALDFELLDVRPISEVARPADFLWQWPAAFVETGVARLIELGRLDGARGQAIRHAFERTATTPGAFLVTPTVLEIIARKLR